MDDYIKRSDALELSRIYFSPDLWEEAVPVRTIRNIPSADVQPVVHGEWTVTSMYIKCSECGEAFMLIPQNFCPNCGADMRGGT